ncbi:hypothetical protein ACK3TF_004687 [Chlorella vulgaris]
MYMRRPAAAAAFNCKPHNCTDRSTFVSCFNIFKASIALIPINIMAGIGNQRRGLIETPSARLDSFVSTNFSRGGGAAIILHPYSVLGGSMNDPQCLELMRVASASPAFSLVVRYNQRGVGRSSGSVNVRGKEDMADVLDVVEWAAEQLPGSDKQVAVIGYSWGSCLAAYALSHPAVVAYVGVSFPLGGLSWVLQTKKHFGELCRSSHDQFTKEAALQEAVLQHGGAVLRRDDSFHTEPAPAAAGQAAASAGTAGAAGAARGLPGIERKQLLLRVFPDSDHFWMSSGSLAAEYAIGWLETLMQPSPQPHPAPGSSSGGAEAAPAAAAAAEEQAAAAAAAAPAAEEQATCKVRSQAPPVAAAAGGSEEVESAVSSASPAPAAAAPAPAAGRSETTPPLPAAAAEPAAAAAAAVDAPPVEASLADLSLGAAEALPAVAVPAAGPSARPSALKKDHTM